MSLRHLFLLITLLLSICFSLRAQISEDFDNANLKSPHLWKGDTSHFSVNNGQQLQLNQSEAGESFIFTRSASIENAVWEFEVQMDFNPSSSNFTDIYLAIDTGDVQIASGYFVRIGDTDDEVSLYRQDGSNAEQEIIINGHDDKVDLSEVLTKVKVTRDQSGSWALYSDVGISGNYQLEGQTFDDSYLGSKYFGIYCHYTKTRADKFYFDNISVTGESKSDTTPPSISKIEILNEYEIRIYFSEGIALSSEPQIHFLENCQFQQPENVTVSNDSIATLSFANAFPENKMCELIMTDIYDRAQNIASEMVAIFNYLPPVQPGFNELLITEIMADPNPEVELPDEEYLELFNPTDQSFEVLDLMLILRGDTLILDDFHIDPKEYLILCSTGAVEELNKYGRTLSVSSWKALLNDGDTLQLVIRYGEQVFAFRYSKEWYGDIEKADGGYSLEMIDTNNPCDEHNNWTASNDVNGGTPGQPNSIGKSNPDNLPPAIDQVIATSPSSLLINFNERVRKESFHLENLSVSPELTWSEYSFGEPLRKSVLFELKDSLKNNTVYALSISGLQDCQQNTMGESELEFVLPELADSLDIVFNELMFNPVPAGVDFIELINLSEKYIDLKNWGFQREKEDQPAESAIITNEHLIIDPGEIIAFTEDKNVLIGQFPKIAEANIFETDLPPMNDDEGRIVLLNNDEKVIDKVYYHEDFHHAMMENKEGVSLERISPGGGSNNPEIWQSAASTAGFATPGLPNSQTKLHEITRSFEISPKVFAPDNDGYRDYASINFQVANSNFLASLYVYDLSGRVVKTLLNNQSIPTEGFVIWEGDDDKYARVPIGNYIVFLELINPEGEKQVYKETVAVATRF